MIYYQGTQGAYSHIAAETIAKNIGILPEEIVGLPSFEAVREHINQGHIGILPVENSYAGSIHENIYNFLSHECTIIGEYDLPIQHALLGMHADIAQIQQAFSHPQALSQCYHFLKKHNIEPIAYSDTATAAMFVAEQKNPHIASISSPTAGRIHHLVPIKENIQDQEGNTTKFFIVTTTTATYTYSEKKEKMSILFAIKEDMHAVLYKCLGAFATNGINLTKIESMPNKQNPFSYMFFITCACVQHEERTKKALEELAFFAKDIQILGEY